MKIIWWESWSKVDWLKRKYIKTLKELKKIFKKIYFANSSFLYSILQLRVIIFSFLKPSFYSALYTSPVFFQVTDQDALTLQVTIDL